MAHYKLASIYQVRSQDKEALAEIEAALQLNPVWPVPIAAGRHPPGRGDFDGALACYKEAVNVAPYMGEAHAKIGEVCLKWGSFTKPCKPTGWHCV